MAGKAKIDLAKLDLGDLEDLKGQVELRITQVREEELKAAFAQVKEICEGVGMAPHQLLHHFGEDRGSQRTMNAPKKTAAPKYCNPGDSSQTWTGRGRKPKWVIAHLEGGGKIEDLSIS